MNFDLCNAFSVSVQIRVLREVDFLKNVTVRFGSVLFAMSCILQSLEACNTKYNPIHPIFIMCFEINVF